MAIPHTWRTYPERPTRRSTGHRPRGRIGILFAALVLVVLTGCSSQGDTPLELTASLNGENVSDGDRSSPLDLSPDEPVRVELTVANPTDDAVRVRHVRFEGEVLEMRFAHANTAVDFTVEPGATRDFAFDVDFFDLGEQVTGHVDAQLSIHDDERETLASEQLFVSVDGSARSSFGVTVLMVALFAAVSFAVNLLGVARGTLPANRWYRGVRFAFTGGTAALLVLMLLAFTGIWLAPMGVWIPVLVGGAVAAFLLGYVSPSPDELLDLTEDPALAKVA